MILARATLEAIFGGRLFICTNRVCKNGKTVKKPTMERIPESIETDTFEMILKDIKQSERKKCSEIAKNHHSWSPNGNNWSHAKNVANQIARAIEEQD